MPGYKLYNHPHPGRWVLQYNHFRIAVWTMERKPSLLAMVKAILLFEEWDETCDDPYVTPLPFKTHRG